ncbi:MAG: hypothetical protein V7K50_21460 [Nostoc sp.]
MNSYFQNSEDAIAPLPSHNRKKPAFHLQGNLLSTVPLLKISDNALPNPRFRA